MTTTENVYQQESACQCGCGAGTAVMEPPVAKPAGTPGRAEEKPGDCGCGCGGGAGPRQGCECGCTDSGCDCGCGTPTD